MTAARRLLGRLWDTDRVLTTVGLGMLLVFAASMGGVVADSRVVGGAPAWSKPAKFGISTAIYSFTLAWIFTNLHEWPRLRRIAGATTAAVFIVEVALIAMQAARGTTSHFNVSTVFDAAVFTVMGIAILVQWVASLAVAVALFREPFADRALGWALRLGVLIAVLGAGIGGLMTRPTEAQLISARTARMTIVGAHTGGAPDGDPVIPGTGWSIDHGDLRVPHSWDCTQCRSFRDSRCCWEALRPPSGARAWSWWLPPATRCWSASCCSRRSADSRFSHRRGSRRSPCSPRHC